MKRGLTTFFEANSSWLRSVLERGRREGTRAFPGAAGDTATMVLRALEGAMLITRMSGDVAGFRTAVDRLLTGLSVPSEELTA
jgi:hypothetical protein